MTDALQFEVKKDKWEQLQNGSYKLTVTMNPTDLTDNNDALLLDFIKCAPGSRFILAAVRIDEDETPAVQKPKTPFRDLPPSQQAGIRCNDPAFYDWVMKQPWADGRAWGETTSAADIAAEFIREECRVSSRAHLDNHAMPREVWHSLNNQFEADTHLPERRS